MLKLESIEKDALIVGLHPAAKAKVVQTRALGRDALTVVYRTPDGAIHERMLMRDEESRLGVAQAGHRVDRRPLRLMFAPLLQHQPNRPFPNLGGKPLGLLHDSILSRI